MQSKRFFGTDGIRGKVGEVPITADWVLKLGWAIGNVLFSQRKSRVVIGKDTRISGYMLESALEAGLASAGTEVSLLGPIPTPGIAYLTRTLQADLGVVISASHNKFCDNGIKLFNSNGSKVDDELELLIEQRISKKLKTVTSDLLGKVHRINDAQGRYIEFCKSTFPKKLDLKGLTIVLDCANGAAYNIAPYVFSELGAQIIPLAIDPDGTNINKECGSTYTQLISSQVKYHHADLGIALDGDGDRVIFADAEGEVIDGDELLYIIANYHKVINNYSGGVVGTVMSNHGLHAALEKIGVPFCRAKVGDRYVMQELHARNWSFGGEGSGHIVCLDSHTTGDGIISALQVLAAVKTFGKSLTELKQPVVKFPQILVNVGVEKKSDPLKIPLIKDAIRLAESKLKNAGRVLLRPSGTEPLMRVMVEGEDESIVTDVAHQLANVVAAEM